MGFVDEFHALYSSANFLENLLRFDKVTSIESLKVGTVCAILNTNGVCALRLSNHRACADSQRLVSIHAPGLVTFSLTDCNI